MYSIKKELSFIKKEFKTNYKCFNEHFVNAQNIKNFDVVWSDSYLNLYPFEAEMNQLPSPKIYNEKPTKAKNIIKNKFCNGEIFYSSQFENEKWGTVFYLYNSLGKIKLLYNDENEDDEMRLSQIEYISLNKDSKIDKVLFYSFDKEIEEETFMIDKYSYNEESKIQLITRDGFYESKEDILPTRTFRFEYIEQNIIIYSKQLKLNGELKEEQIFPQKK